MGRLSNHRSTTNQPQINRRGPRPPVVLPASARRAAEAGDPVFELISTELIQIRGPRPPVVLPASAGRAAEAGDSRPTTDQPQINHLVGLWLVCGWSVVGLWLVCG